MRHEIPDSIKAMLPVSVLTKKQVRIYERLVSHDGGQHKIKAEVRYDDQCGNGHNSFAITGELMGMSGCIHDEIAKHFPELQHLIKWHHCTSDGPMHYLANTLYQAGDRDHNGRRAGEPSAWQEVIWFSANGRTFPIPYRVKDYKFFKWLQTQAPTSLVVTRVPHTEKNPSTTFKYNAKYTFVGYTNKWHECPFDTHSEASELRNALVNWKPVFDKIPTQWSEGKAPDLEATRHSAIWADATLEQLQDKAALLARLPALMQGFKSDVEALGFIY